MNQILNIFS